MSFGPVIPRTQANWYQEWHYAPGFAVGDLLFLSGATGIGTDGSVPATDAEQARNAFAVLGAALAEAGVGFAEIVEMTSYHVDIADQIATFRAVKDEFIREPYPAWTAIGVHALATPGARVEIKATALSAAGRQEHRK